MKRIYYILYRVSESTENLVGFFSLLSINNNYIIYHRSFDLDVPAAVTLYAVHIYV